MIKVSIIVPIYNVSKYIIRCVDSVINQTYSNIECILVDDCSPDDSMELVQARLKSYQGSIDFKIIRHPENKGLSGARNTGTYASTGGYIYYLDSDDEITPDCIATLIALVEKYPDVEMVQGNTQTIPEPPKKSDWRNILYKDFPEYVDDNYWIRQHFLSIPLKSIPVNAWNKLVKRDFIFENNYFFKEGIIHEDVQWMFWVVKNLKSVVFTTDYTYAHYVTLNSIMQSANNYASINSYYIILKEIFDNQGCGETAEQKKQYLLLLKANIIKIRRDDTELINKYKYLVKTILKNELKNCSELTLSLFCVWTYLIMNNQNIILYYIILIFLKVNYVRKKLIGY